VQEVGETGKKDTRSQKQDYNKFDFLFKEISSLLENLFHGGIK
jgi:hypothetical protein